MIRILNRLLNLFYHHHHKLPVNVLSTHLIFTVFSIEVVFSLPSCRSCYLLPTSLLTSLAGSNSGRFFPAEQSEPNCVRSFRSAVQEPNFRVTTGGGPGDERSKRTRKCPLPPPRRKRRKCVSFGMATLSYGSHYH